MFELRTYMLRNVSYFQGTWDGTWKVFSRKSETVVSLFEKGAKPIGYKIWSFKPEKLCYLRPGGQYFQ